MSHLSPATTPFQIISIDTIGGFGGSRSTKKNLHLLVDHFTRYAYILTSKTQISNDFIKLVEKNHKKTIRSIQFYRPISGDQFKGIQEIFE